MPETTDNKTGEEPETGATTSSKPLAEQTPEEQAEFWRAQARKHEDTLKGKTGMTLDEIKDLKKKAEQFDQLEESNKTELQKALDRAAAAEKAQGELQSKLDAVDARTALDKVRSDVAATKGISANLLRGESKEDFESFADALIEAGIKAKPAPSTDGQGDTGEQVTTDGEKSADEIVDEVTGR